MAGTDVMTGQMVLVAANVEEIIARYNASIERLYQIGGEIDAMWDGEASDKFKAILGGDRERFQAMTNLLVAYVDTLRHTVTIYVKAESDVKDVLNTNTIR